MKKIFLALIFIPLLAATNTAYAHPADLYLHRINANISSNEMRIEWNIIPGPLLAQIVWFEADSNQDEIISDAEAKDWVKPHIPELLLTINNRPIPLELQSITFPASMESISVGSEKIILIFNTAWDADFLTENQIILQNNFKSQNSLSFYIIKANNGLGLYDAKQSNNSLIFSLTTNPSDKTIISWETGRPSIPFVVQAAGLGEVAQQAAEQSQTQTGYGAMLEGFIRSKESSPSFIFAALAIALITGALHALTPGHGKTIVAAYLIGARGTLKHAIFLGGIVTLTHTGSVFLIGITALAASQYIFPTSLFPILEIISGILIVALGFNLLIQRIKEWRGRTAPHSHPHADTDQHTHSRSKHDHAHEHPHKKHRHHHDIPNPEDVTWHSLLTLGISGGLVPCPEAIAILLLAVNINRIVLGLSLIIAFSVGLAFILIAIGMVLVQSKRLFSKLGFIDRWAYIIPIVSALIVLGLGVGLTAGAVIKARESRNQIEGQNEAGLVEQSQAGVLFMNEDENRRQQIFIKKENDITQITNEDSGVHEMSVSLDGGQIAYSASNKDGSTSLWLIDAETITKKELLHCAVAVCSQVTWSHETDRVLYARADFNEQMLGLPSVWWLNVENGETSPVFDSGLPIYSFNWSPDAQWMTYTSVITPNVEVYNLSNGENVSIPAQTGGRAMWSPNSDAFIFSDARLINGKNLRKLILYSTKKNKTTELFTAESFDDYDPAWSPDGKQIAFLRFDSLGEQIWIMGANGNGAKKLTNDDGVFHGNLAFSKDGKSLLFSYSEKSLIESQIGILDVETGAMSKVSKGNFPLWLK